MSKVLTKEIAEQWIADEDSHDLSEFTIIDDAAAESLSKHEGDLGLDGLTELSDAAAESLSKHEGTLTLNGLTELSDAEAASLSKHEGELSLDGLTDLSDKVAAEFTNRVGSIKLNGLTELSEAAADSLSHVEGVVELNGISELNPAVAKCLAHCRRGLYLNGLTELSVEVAAGLSRSKEGLILEGLTKLNDEVAEHLSQVKGTLSLSNGRHNSLLKISDASAEILSKHEGALHFNSPVKLLSDAAITSLSKKQGTINWIKSSDWAEAERQLNRDSTLGKEQAQEYVDCSDPHLTDFKRIAVDAAELLSANLTELYLDGLTELSDEAAGSLSKHEGTLTLNGLTELSDAAAASLSKHEGDLSLDGLTELSDETAKALSEHKNGLGLNGLTELSDAAAASLSKHEGVLYLNGLTELSDEAAASLSQHEGVLWLNGLTELSDEAAASLSQHEGALSLDGLTELSDEAAGSLSKHEGTLTLNGLTELSDEAAASLSQHEGVLWLNGLTELSDENAAALAKVKGELGLDGVTELSDKAIESLSLHKGNLWLDGVAELSDTTAEAISNHEGELSLNGLTELSDAVAEILSLHKGSLWLNGLTELSDGAAAALAKVKGELGLDGVTELSDKAIESLSRHQGDLWLRGLSELSDTALEILSKKTGKINDADPEEWAEEFKQNRENSEEEDESMDDNNEKSEQKVLTKEIAKQYADYVETYEGEIDDISEYTHLGEGAAQILSGMKERLDLGLRELSDSDADILLGHKNDLNFNSNSLMKISNEAAKILAQYGGELQLSHVLVGEEGKQALRGRKNVQDESEYHSYVTIIDEKWVEAYDPDSDYDDQNKYLECPIAAKILVDAAQGNASEDYNEYANTLGSFNYYSVEALREIANYQGELDFVAGEKFDVNGSRWTDEHFGALGHCSGPLSLFCGGCREKPDEAITAKQLGMFRDQDLTLEYITALTEDCHDSINGRSGSLSMSNFGNVSPRIAKALSTVKNLDLGEVSNCESLNQLLGPGSSIENLSLGTKYIDGEIAAALSTHGGNLNLRDFIYLTEEAAKCLGQKKGGLEMPEYPNESSIFVEGNGTEALLQHPDSDNWAETEVYDENEEWVKDISWVQAVNQVIEESDVKITKEGEGDDGYTQVELPSRPLITDDALKKVIAAGSSSGEELFLLRSISDQQAVIISSLKGNYVRLGLCRLTDEQIDSLLKIRGQIVLPDLRDVSEDGAKKLIGSKKVGELGGELGVSKLKHENEPHADHNEDEDEDEEKTDNKVDAVYFTYGRLRHRLESGDPSMGGPEELLDVIESEIKSGDFPHKTAMREFLLGQLFLACAEGKDTTSIKEKIAEIFWNSEEEVADVTNEEIIDSSTQSEELKEPLDQIQIVLTEIQAQLISNSNRLDILDRLVTTSPQQAPARIDIPAPAAPKGALEDLNPELQKVMELCCIYLAAVDNLFTDVEQDWVDRQFGIGSSAHFARVIEIINWQQFFSHIYSLIVALPVEDKNWIQANSTNLFRDLLECDGLDPEEEKRLNELIGYIKHACSS